MRKLVSINGSALAGAPLSPADANCFNRIILLWGEYRHFQLVQMWMPWIGARVAEAVCLAGCGSEAPLSVPGIISSGPC